MKIRYFDAFAGYGGFSLGIQKAYVEVSSRSKDRRIKESTEGNDETGERLESVQGEADSVSGRQYSPNLTNGENERPPHCVGYSEIDKYAVQVYSKHFPTHKPYGDITKLDPNTIPDFDLFVGGFPCQAFSIAGKRKGFADTRGTLFFDIARILKVKNPKNILLENVKGLLSHDNGNTFKTIITSLAELGYDLQWQVLNSKNFGVPQNRERVFIVGHLRGFGGRQVFPIGTGDEFDTKSYGQGNEVAYCLNAGGDKHRGSYIRQLNNPTQQGGNRQPKICKPVLTPDRLEKRQKGRRMKEDGEPSFTLNTQDKHGIYDGMRIRRLTPTECERLMGLPDGWTEGVSDTQRYKLCGNGVVVNVVEEIVKRLL